VVIQRLTGDPHPAELVAPQWSLRKRETLGMIKTALEERNTWQGKRLGCSRTWAFRAHSKIMTHFGRRCIQSGRRC